ncbi:polysaccharide deacetylase [Sporosarcina sp. P12(2017)]|uniref:polysaccharide deacetylase family protein n=1 Tax=unclassified Sporosarcina TaxID=2647733 RepID=UPI000C16ED73|nr:MULTISPECIES: polysaccharide deacetylase family protein [unclassified Sporosarcina]PIC56347.1 polysaccharide deacetylase [Sporosarcina sp. P10]PIC59644.1 polysaccharide deacetylase [Sporosarcina sp. P12(2017)]
MKRKSNEILDYEKKNRHKVRRSIFQLCILLVIVFLVFQTFVEMNHYDASDTKEWKNKRGFIALSYPGVSRDGSDSLFAKKQLQQQLEALMEQGYETISQQDILNFYNNKKPLPEKALFLAFEDGRTDTSVFVNPLLKKYNYKATLLSFTNKLDENDKRFLQPSHLKQMQNSGFWELGSNGNRLTYINIFNKEGTFLNIRDDEEILSKDEINSYNHFLMDFIRDQNLIPSENRVEMEKRITNDYEEMRNVYQKQLGTMPGVYMIMHANGLYNTANKLVTEVNDKEIRKTFDMHFNQEGDAYNTRDKELYNLSRVQPKTSWSTNHLLMKILSDTNQKVDFVKGNEKQAKQWKTIESAAEFHDNTITLTSKARKHGKLVLTESTNKDIQFTGKVGGTAEGQQSIYLRRSDNGDSYVKIAFENDQLVIEEKVAGQLKELLATKPIPKVTMKQITDQDKTTSEIEDKAQRQKLFNEKKLIIELQDNKLNIWLNDRKVVNKLVVNREIQAGKLALGSTSIPGEFNDPIHDAQFSDVTIASLANSDVAQTILFTNEIQKPQQLMYTFVGSIKSAMNWVVDNF